MRKTIAVAAALTITLGACSGKSSTPGPSAAGLADRIERIRQRSLEGTTVFASFLKPVGDCDALLAHIQTEAAARVGPYGLPGLGYGGGPMALAGTGATARATEESAKAATPASPSQGTSGRAGTTPDFSGTNNQENGVDEPDIVKTDGKRIVTLTGNRLTVVEATGAVAGAVRKVSIGGDTFSPGELLMVGDRALVFGTSYDASSGGPKPMPAGRGIAVDSYPGHYGSGSATITEVDLSGTGAPKVGTTLKIDGAYLTGRLVGSTVRVVVRSVPKGLDFVTPQNAKGESRARKANEEVVLGTTLADWLASYELVDAAGRTLSKGLLTECANVDAPTEFAGFGSLSVLTFDATRPLTDGDAVTILAGGETVYASDTNLYVATQTWIDPEQQGNTTMAPIWQRDFATAIHQFSIDGAAPARYLASGNAPGYLLNQFSMSEYKGVLRLASTKGAPWNTPTKSESVITTLKRAGDKLEQLGQVGDMGRGERIYSVRFAEDTAYVVTFRQTDPFYTIDLSSPTKPKVVGELKVTGYSGYLHPIGDNLVIGVGQEATTQGRLQGTKVSLFDVSDLGNPKELAKWSVPSSQSGAEWDHHAFLWWPTTKTLVLPLAEYNRGNGSYGAVVLSVDRATGITEKGRVSHGTEKPANLGASDCRRAGAEEMRQWGAPTSDSLALVCEPGQAGGAVGYQCNRISSPEINSFAPGAATKVPKGGHIEFCYPVWNQPMPVQRSLVIGNSLWTLSQQRLQANELGTLVTTARVDL